MNDDTIITFKLDPDHPPATDWSAFDALTEEEQEAAARSDPDSPPLTEEQLARTRRVAPGTLGVKALQSKLGLTQKEFATRFHLPLGTVRDWERGREGWMPPRRSCCRLSLGTRKRCYKRWRTECNCGGGEA